MGEVAGLKLSELRILDFITRNANATTRELARAAGVDENTARRIYNRLFADNTCSHLVLPNYPQLGYKIMIIQRIRVKSSALPDMRSIKSIIESEWKNCTDCCETFDGKVYVRSVWKDADDFKQARTRLHQKYGFEWVRSEEVDMVPLDEKRRLLNVRSLWEDEDAKSVS